MSYTSLGYMLFVACCLIFYYIFPKKHRWWGRYQNTAGRS